MEGINGPHTFCAMAGSSWSAPVPALGSIFTARDVEPPVMGGGRVFLFVFHIDYGLMSCFTLD